MTRFDAIDRSILRELQLDGRLTNQELADRVGLSPSPCLRRVRALESAGVISGYRAVVAQQEVGLSITAFVRLRLSSHATHTVEAVEAELRSLPEVVEAYVLAGDHDYLLKVVAESFAGYEQLLRDRIRDIPSLASIETTFAFGVTKDPSPVPVP
ncbi:MULTISPECIES: Lrp/AsnC family transcriptional regulator [unclassified Aeromicrobium]|jgi:Lrp/AsnC family transcriptional regulator, leucine-responsive regulatory protein|uniref:Lrp/AsnC family transcriptional regulator n=1 Tax=unclassified Aeromicrobium TaxID=2633570 RepID=UPI002097BD71|nr:MULTISPECIES: Lrp/AsnC family transcriptional regulator [unclassified Aeromicrobium]MCO7238731.1 Lrp/AsnC family transcriptional regulator [Aeromicrobium sp. CnD17-E]MDR6119531.1 Lrp/AsnC family leucine-responsive transcriptional regulator [Aeromicrobium sp. SORGH_AS_0981]